MSNRRYRECKKSKTCKRRNQRRKQRTRKQRTRKQKSRSTHKRKHVTWGGNYDTDFTSTTLEGTPTKSPHKYTVAVPGQPIMSGKTYTQLMEKIDRNGPD